MTFGVQGQKRPEEILPPAFSGIFGGNPRPARSGQQLFQFRGPVDAQRQKLFMAGPCFNGITQRLRPFFRREACLGQHRAGLAFFGRKLLDLEKGPAPEQRELNLP